MKTLIIEKNIYTAKELLELYPNIFKSAKYKYHEHENFFDFHGENYTFNSLKNLKYFGIILKEIDVERGIYWKKNDEFLFDYTIDFDLYDLKGIRFYKYFINNILKIESNYHSEPKKYYKKSKKRYSKIFREISIDPANYTLNYIFEKTLKEFNEQFRKNYKNYSFKDFQCLLMDNIELNLKSEYDYYISDEYFLESCMANDYYFDIQGNICHE